MDVSPTTGSHPSLFERLLAESREAHALGQQQVAYHALTAAMHAADNAADVRALQQVGREAAAQLEHIDLNVPDHRLSTRSAARHLHPGVYTLLTRQSAMHVQMHESRQRAGESLARAHVPDDTRDVLHFRGDSRSLGGDVQVKSTPGAGSTFTVTLPIIAPTDRGESTPDADARAADED